MKAIANRTILGTYPRTAISVGGNAESTAANGCSKGKIHPGGRRQNSVNTVLG
jgi:hypothetical protein